MDLAYSKEHINTFVILSGDSDFSPLVSKLKELGKHVIGLGITESTSDLLRDNCDEFIYYEDLGQSAALAPPIEMKIPENKRKVFTLLMESLLALRRENKEVLWSSMVKDTMKRKKPSFNETYHGYRTFSELLEDAAKHGLLELDTDKRSRTYVVSRFGSEMHSAPPAPPRARGEASKAAATATEAGSGKKKRRRQKGKGRTAQPATAGAPEGVVSPVDDAVDDAEDSLEDQVAEVREAFEEGPPFDDFEAEPITDDDVTFPGEDDKGPRGSPDGGERP
jgi:hypothetical protein